MTTVLFDQLNRSFNPSSYEGLRNDIEPGECSHESRLRPSVWLVLTFLLALFLMFNLKNLPGMWHVSSPISRPRIFHTDALIQDADSECVPFHPTNTKTTGNAIVLTHFPTTHNDILGATTRN